MNGTKKIIYWDANIFLAWMNEKEQQIWESKLENINKIRSLCEKGQLIIATSSMTIAEVRRAYSPDFYPQFEKTRRNQNYLYVAADNVVTELAHDICEYYFQEGRVIKTPDAIHLASCILYRSDYFCTLDSKLLNLNPLEFRNRTLPIMRPSQIPPLN